MGGAVTPVKNQGQCGSCWAFSTTGSTEGAWKIAGNSLVSLAEQQLVDCDKVDSGCNGGLMDNGFSFLEKNAACTESSYTYTARDGTCQASGCSVAIPQGGVTGYKDVSGESGLASAVQQQPVSVAIEADLSSFQLYSGGVMSGSCGTQLDHGVLAVGFGTDGGVEYWKVKNSWGASWGESGYIRMKKGINQCGIANQPSYPVVDGSAPPSPTPTPTPGQTHYGEPPCLSDEQAASVTDSSGNVIGVVCTAPCDASGNCPTDVPAGMSNPNPTCGRITDQAGDQYCALGCSLLGADCPTGASCSGLVNGICTYPTGATEFQVSMMSSVTV